MLQRAGLLRPAPRNNGTVYRLVTGGLGATRREGKWWCRPASSGTTTLFQLRPNESKDARDLRRCVRISPPEWRSSIDYQSTSRKIVTRIWKIKMAESRGLSMGKPRTAKKAAMAVVPSSGEVRVGVYVRRSTDEEHQPYLIEAQDASLTAYIESQPGWTLAKRFADDASGATTNRPGLQRALTAARTGAIDVLLVYWVDRFPAACGTWWTCSTRSPRRVWRSGR